MIRFDLDTIKACA